MYIYACLHVSNGTRKAVLTSDGLKFDHVKFISDEVTFVRVMSKVSVLPCIYDGIVMHVIAKVGVFDFVWLGRTSNWIIICELREDWFDFIVVYYYQIPCVNVMNNIWWVGIKQCVIFGKTSLFI